MESRLFVQFICEMNGIIIGSEDTSKNRDNLF